jgi:hypothetical protein
MHLNDNQPSLEGVLGPTWGTEYVLQLAKIVTETGSHELTGPRVRVPRERVVFIQELK